MLSIFNIPFQLYVWLVLLILILFILTYKIDHIFSDNSGKSFNNISSRLEGITSEHQLVLQKHPMDSKTVSRLRAMTLSLAGWSREITDLSHCWWCLCRRTPTINTYSSTRSRTIPPAKICTSVTAGEMTRVLCIADARGSWKPIFEKGHLIDMPVKFTKSSVILH